MPDHPATETPAELPEPPAELMALRSRIDDLDRQLLEILAQRLAVCHDVARIKESRDLPIIQPRRVRDVVTSRRQEAIDLGVDPDFAEQVMRVVLAETHRIEVAGRRSDAAPSKTAASDVTRSEVSSTIDTIATRVDHIVVAVEDLDAALAVFTSRFGFHRSTAEVDERPGIAVVAAGGVTVVLVDPAAGPDVAAHIATHGSGLHHVAIEVLNAELARTVLGDAPAGDGPALGDIMVDDHGHEQFFTVRDALSGVQFGFIARTGHRVGVATANVLQAFRR